jgi:hypothetical protein
VGSLAAKHEDFVASPTTTVLNCFKTIPLLWALIAASVSPYGFTIWSSPEFRHFLQYGEASGNSVGPAVTVKVSFLSTPGVQVDKNRNIDVSPYFALQKYSSANDVQEKRKPKTSKHHNGSESRNRYCSRHSRV